MISTEGIETTESTSVDGNPTKIVNDKDELNVDDKDDNTEVESDIAKEKNEKQSKEEGEEHEKEENEEEDIAQSESKGVDNPETEITNVHGDHVKEKSDTGELPERSVVRDTNGEDHDEAHDVQNNQVPENEKTIESRSVLGESGGNEEETIFQSPRITTLGQVLGEKRAMIVMVMQFLRENGLECTEIALREELHGIGAISHLDDAFDVVSKLENANVIKENHVAHKEPGFDIHSDSLQSVSQCTLPFVSNPNADSSRPQELESEQSIEDDDYEEYDDDDYEDSESEEAVTIEHNKSMEEREAIALSEMLNVDNSTQDKHGNNDDDDDGGDEKEEAAELGWQKREEIKEFLSSELQEFAQELLSQEGEIEKGDEELMLLLGTKLHDADLIDMDQYGGEELEVKEFSPGTTLDSHYGHAQRDSSRDSAAEDILHGNDLFDGNDEEKDTDKDTGEDEGEIDEWDGDDDPGYRMIAAIRGVDDIYEYCYKYDDEYYPDQTIDDESGDDDSDNEHEIVDPELVQYLRQYHFERAAMIIGKSNKSDTESDESGEYDSDEETVASEELEQDTERVVERCDGTTLIKERTLKTRETTSETEDCSLFSVRLGEIGNAMEESSSDSPNTQTKKSREDAEEIPRATEAKEDGEGEEQYFENNNDENQRESKTGPLDNIHGKEDDDDDGNETEPVDLSEVDEDNAEEEEEEEDDDDDDDGEERTWTSYGKRPSRPVEEFQTLYLPILHDKNRTGFEETKDFPIELGTVIANRYRIVDYLGSAAFSTAVHCVDLETEENVCVKIIKNSKEFLDQSLDEIKMLRLINSKGDPDRYSILQLYDFFYHKEHLFLVTELLRDNLFEFYRYNRESGDEPYFIVPRLQRIARQVLSGLKFIHDLNIIHCDLKPENILIKSYSRCEVKVIDFGSSSFVTDPLSTYIQSRSYRAPEVIFGMPHYDQRIDIWSLGCILAELFTGRVLFQNRSIQTMLAKIISICGFPDKDMFIFGRFAPKFFSRDFVLYERSRRDPTRIYFLLPKHTTLRKRLDNCEDALFVDFLQKCLQINPKHRMSTGDALRHPWLRKSYHI